MQWGKDKVRSTYLPATLGWRCWIRSYAVGAASVPLALDEAVRTDRIVTGDRVLLEAFGGGLTWGAALVRW